MEKVKIDGLRDLIYSSGYSDAYGLIKNNIEVFRVDPDEDKEDIFNREMLNYFRTIRVRSDYLDIYKAGLLNINFFNRKVALYLLDSGIDLNTMFDPIFSNGCRLKDRIVSTAKDSTIIKKVLDVDDSINLYKDGENSITPIGAYLRAGDLVEARLSMYRKINYLVTSDEINSVIERFKNDGYCVLNTDEDKMVHYFHNIVEDIDTNMEDDRDKIDFLTTILYAFDYPIIEAETLPIIKKTMGSYLYDAYKYHLEKEIENGKKQIIRVIGFGKNSELFDNKCSVMEKAPSYVLNVNDNDIKKYIKTKEVG